MSIKPEDITVFILAAGRGQRMMPLTATKPKPLLKIGELSLIEHHINRLTRMGFKEFVINIAYLGEAIRQLLGDGKRWGAHITFSDEQAQGALETAGGIHNALPLIKSENFLCINADIWTDFDFTQLLAQLSQTSQLPLFSAAIILVDNPAHNPEGDFALINTSTKQGKLELVQHKNRSIPTQQSYTFSGIGLYSKNVFKTLNPGKNALAPLLRQWIDNNSLFGMRYDGQWSDIGTPARLEEINKQLAQQT